MKQTLTKTIAILLLTLAFIASGGSISSPAHAQDNSLPAGVIGTEWKLMEIQRSAQDVLSTAHVNITLKFDAEGRAGGDSTCNYYGMSYQTGPGQALTFHDLISTLRACVDTSLMDLETEYYTALQGVTTYGFDGETLQLFYNNGGSVLKFGTATMIPGMPKTGRSGADPGGIAVAGLLLALSGAVLLASVQIAHRKSRSGGR